MSVLQQVVDVNYVCLTFYSTSGSNSSDSDGLPLHLLPPHTVHPQVRLHITVLAGLRVKGSVVCILVFLYSIPFVALPPANSSEEAKEKLEEL